MQFLKVMFLLTSILLFSNALAQTNVFVGSINDSDAQIAFVIGPSAVLAYTCGGNRTWGTHSSWFIPTEDSVLGNGSFTLSSDSGHKLQGIYSSDNATGTLTLIDGTKLEWTAMLAEQNSPAGLYILNEKDATKEYLIGLIVTNSLQATGNIRRILTGLSSEAALFQPVGLAQALPNYATESLTVCYTLDGNTDCQNVVKPLGASLD